jgi:hypothetical protein
MMGVKRMFSIVKWMALLATSAVIAACGGSGDAGSSPFGSGGGGSGGGGGGGGGGGATGPSITIALQDSNGVAIAPAALTGAQNATVVVQATNASGQADSGKVVTVSGTGLVFTPASGQALTDASGIAKVQVKQLDPFGSGATTISASSALASATLDVALGAATATLGTLTTSAATVGAYQTVQVSVPVTLTGSGAAGLQLPVAFSASCGAFDPATAVSGSDGVARSAYRNQTGATACAGNVTLSATVGSSVATTTIAAQAPTPVNIQFVGADPARIFLAGSPGVNQSTVKFKLLDASGNPVSGQNINLTLTLFPPETYLGSIAGATSVTQSTDSNGEVAVAVNAGNAPGPLQIQAALQGSPTIKNISNALAVASGWPVQKAFSLSVETFNIEALTVDGVETGLTVRLADRLGNPVPDGTTINFVSSGGQVVASCLTTGERANDLSSCSVKLGSQQPRPSDGIVTVLAWAQGEETFTDQGATTNNVYDAGEPFEDLGQPYLDKNHNSTYDQGVDVTVGTASGASACSADTNRTVGPLSTPGTCNQAWLGGALVRADARIIFSGSNAFVSKASPFVTQSGTVCTAQFTVKDVNGNPMPSGTTLSVSNVVGGGPDTTATPPAKTNATFVDFGGEGGKVPNTSLADRTTHTAIFSNCAKPSELTFILKVTTPSGIVTTIPLP